jgi:hypothetical protein
LKTPPAPGGLRIDSLEKDLPGKTVGSVHLACLAHLVCLSQATKPHELDTKETIRLSHSAITIGGVGIDVFSY